MKLEGFLKAGIVVVTILSVFFLIYGYSNWTMLYDIDEKNQTFTDLDTSINTRFTGLSVIEDTYENNTLLRYTKVGEAEEGTTTTEDVNFFEYQARSFKATGDALISSGSWLSGIDTVLNYLKVPNIIIGALTLLLIISLAFALITFWRGRRA